LAQSALTRIFFLRLETKPNPGTHLEMAMYFLLKTQMSVQSKSAPSQLTPLTRQWNHEQQLYTHSKACMLFETSAFKTTSSVILKL